MSKLDELMIALCPNGVKYQKIKEVYKRLKGTSITATKMKEIGTMNGDIRIFAGGKTFIDTYEKNIQKANITRVPAVLVQSRGIIDVVYYERPFTFKNEMWAYTHDNKTSIKYLYYVLKNNIEKFRTSASGMGSLPQISLKVTEEFKIPVPPIDVQQEIVRILDNFTELTAELTARKKQYEFYRNKLFDFTNYQDKENNTIVWKTLGEVCDILVGYPFNSSQFKTSGVKLLRGMNVKRGVLEFSPEIDKYWISDDGLDKYKLADGDIVIAMDGSLVGKSFGVVRSSHLPLLLVQRVARLRVKNVNQQYIYQYISCKFHQYVEKKKTAGAIPHISQKDIADLQIPIPNIEVQNKIASILSDFDSICSDLTSGLPAEIEARKKQYEYYRDKLLTFPEKK